MRRYFLLIMLLGCWAGSSLAEALDAEPAAQISDSAPHRDTLESPAFVLDLPKGWRILEQQSVVTIAGYNRERVQITYWFIGTGKNEDQQKWLAERAKKQMLGAMAARASHSDLDPQSSQLMISLAAGGEFHQQKSFNHRGDIYFFQYGLIGPHAAMLVSVEGLTAMQDRIKPFEAELARLRWVTPATADTEEPAP